MRWRIAPVEPKKHSVPRHTATSLSPHDSTASASLPREESCSRPRSSTQKDVALPPSRYSCVYLHSAFRGVSHVWGVACLAAALRCAPW